MPRRRLTIADFLTDGILARLCDTAARISGAVVTLRDLDGRRIVATDDDRRWTRLDPDDDAASVGDMLGRVRAERAARLDDGQRLHILRVYGRPIGGILMSPPPETADTRDADAEEFVALLTEKTSQFCDRDARLQDRHSELAVLYRLSSLLVGVRERESVLEVALGSVIDMLRVSGGVVRLFGQDETPLQHAALPDDFVRRLERDAVLQRWLDRDITERAGVEVGFVFEETDPAIAACFREANVEGWITIALHFKGRRLGAMHLFMRRRRDFDRGELALLRIVSEQIAVAVASAEMIEAEREHRRVQRQVQLAAEVQRRMLPDGMPAVPNLDLAARYESCFELGGDLYDVFDLNGSVGLVVGDVVGKGVPAALLMASVRASLRAHAADVYHLDDIMTKVNAALTRDTRDNEFATVFYGVIDPRSLTLTYCNAGHEPPIILRRDPRGRYAIESLRVGGLVLGIVEDAPYERMLTRLNPGDILLMTTDGVMDAQNFDEERYGRERLHNALLEFLHAKPDATARNLADHVIWEVRRFTGLRAETDDATVMVVRVK